MSTHTYEKIIQLLTGNDYKFKKDPLQDSSEYTRRWICHDADPNDPKNYYIYRIILEKDSLTIKYPDGRELIALLEDDNLMLYNYTQTEEFTDKIILNNENYSLIPDEEIIAARNLFIIAILKGFHYDLTPEPLACDIKIAEDYISFINPSHKDQKNKYYWIDYDTESDYGLVLESDNGLDNTEKDIIIEDLAVDNYDSIFNSNE